MKLISVLLACSVLLASAEAQTSDDAVLAAYQAYNRAIEAGDSATALKEAKRAYDLAEEVWGPTRKETALLATNYGDQLLVQKNYRAATKIFERCEELLEGRIGDSRFELGYCQYRLGQAQQLDNRKQRAEASYLRALVTFEPLVEADVNAAIYSGEVYLALAGLSAPGEVQVTSPEQGAEKIARRLEDTRDYGRKARELLIKAQGEDALLVGHAYLAEGIYYEWAREWETARDFYEKAYLIFAKKLGEDNVDTRMAYGRFSYAGAKAAPNDNQPQKKDGVCEPITRNDIQISVCPIKRKPPRFPNSTLYKGQNGFALLRYDIDQSGKVMNPRIIESWPGDEFDKAALKAVRHWEFTKPVTMDGTPIVARDIETLITFEIIW